MTEQYNFKKDNNERTFFNHLLLEGDVSKLTKSKEFDSSDLTVDLKINGCQVQLRDFNEVLKGWGDRIERQIKGQINYLEGEQAVVQKAEQLIRDKIGNIQDILSNIEDSLWKLEVD